MSMHKIPLTPLEEEGLRLHGLPIGTPSQRSDTFRQGVAWAIGEARRLNKENERLKADAERIEWQPIETAPKGVRILGYRPNFGGDKFYECEWIDRDDCEMWKVGATVSTIKAFPQFKPTNWMQLPEPPK